MIVVKLHFFINLFDLDGNDRVTRALTFNDDDELLGIQFENDLESILSTDSSYQRGDISSKESVLCLYMLCFVI